MDIITELNEIIEPLYQKNIFIKCANLVYIPIDSRESYYIRLNNNYDSKDYFIFNDKLKKCESISSKELFGNIWLTNGNYIQRLCKEDGGIDKFEYIEYPKIPEILLKNNQNELTQEEVYQLFDKEFLDKFKYNVIFQNIIYGLSKGMSPYEAIQILIDEINYRENSINDLIEKMKPTPILLNFENLPEKIKNDMKKFNKNERKYY